MGHFAIIELSLLIFPVLGFLLFKIFKKSKEYKTLILLLSASLVIYYSLRIFNISLIGDFPDTIMLCISYFAFSNMVFWILLVRSKIIKIPVLIIALIPILTGYITGTIGILGLLMITGDFEATEVKDLSNNIQYRKYGFGNATTSFGGDEFNFYKSYKLLPFEKRIAKVKMDSREYKLDNPNVEFTENPDNYAIIIKSNEQTQIDTLIEKRGIGIISRSKLKDRTRDKLIDNHSIPDSSKLETPSFFNDPLRNLKDFTIQTNYPDFDKIINDLSNSNNAQDTIISEFCWGDCCGSYKVITDTLSKSTLYLFKNNCFEYSFGNDQYLFVKDTLSMIRNYRCMIYDFRTDSTSPSIKMEEKLIIFNTNGVTIKERSKTVKGDDNYTLNNIDFKNTIVDKADSLKKKSEEFKNKIDFITKIKEEERLGAEERRLKIEKQNEIINNLTREQLSSLGESRRKIFDNLLTSGAMKEKRHYVLKGTKNSITAYYQHKRIVMIIYQTVNSLNAISSTSAFYFDESNNCIYSTNWSTVDKRSYTLDMHWGSLIKYDANYNRIEIDPFQKPQIIESQRTMLASIMQYFPGFKYTFHWK